VSLKVIPLLQAFSSAIFHICGFLQGADFLLYLEVTIIFAIKRPSAVTLDIAYDGDRAPGVGRLTRFLQLVVG